MTNLYAIVEFLELQQLAVVPSHRLSAEKEECFWPPPRSNEFKLISTLIKKSLHISKIIGMFSTSEFSEKLVSVFVNKKLLCKFPYFKYVLISFMLRL